MSKKRIDFGVDWGSKDIPGTPKHRIAELESQLAKTKKDAERYRWICDHYEWQRHGTLADTDSHIFVGFRLPYLANLECEGVLDVNIDYMRKALAGEEAGNE